MAENFKAMVWSKAIETSLKRQMVFANIVNRSFEGAIKGVGDSIKILGVVRPSVTKLSDANAKLGDPEQITDNSTLLKVTQQDLIMYLIGDVDKAQSVDGYVQAIGKESAQAYAGAADTYIAGLYDKAGKSVSLSSCTKNTVLSKLYEAQEHLMEQDVPYNEIVAVITPKCWSRVAEAAQEIVTDNRDIAENGKMGKLRGMTLYVSNDVASDASNHDHCLVMSKGAIAYYEQIDEVEKFRESAYIGDIIRCLHTYGADVVRAQELVDLDIAAYA